MKLKMTLRWMMGEELITHLGQEYYDYHLRPLAEMDRNVIVASCSAERIAIASLPG